MGAVDATDTLGALAALELVLASMGYKLTLGAGVAAAQRVLANQGT
jgi:aspartate aminotransferase-like enzyme